MKQCCYCGRVGFRGFVSLGQGGGLICLANRACSRRRRAQDRPFLRIAARRKSAA
jgi:hypothetical protein